VSFFNGVYGFVAAAELGLAASDGPPEKNFRVGQPVKCRVLRCIAERRQLHLSLFVRQRQPVSRSEREKGGANE
jgi:ribosomal protein S1